MTFLHWTITLVIGYHLLGILGVVQERDFSTFVSTILNAELPKIKSGRTIINLSWRWRYSMTDRVLEVVTQCLAIYIADYIIIIITSLHQQQVHRYRLFSGR